MSKTVQGRQNRHKVSPSTLDMPWDLRNDSPGGRAKKRSANNPVSPSEFHSGLPNTLTRWDSLGLVFLRRNPSHMCT